MTAAATVIPERRRNSAAVRHRRINKAISTLRADNSARVSLWREIGGLIEQKFDLAAALDTIRYAHSDADLRPDEPLALLAAHWAAQLRDNQPFHEVVAPITTDRERMLIQVGVSTDHLATVLNRLAGFEATLVRLAQLWRSSLSTPGFLLLWSWGLILANTYAFVAMAHRSRQPMHGLALKILGACESFLYVWSWLIPLVLLAVGGLVAWSLPRWLDERRVRIEHRWPYNMYKAPGACEFLMALNILVATRQDFSPALRLMSRTAGRYLRWQIDAVEPWTRSLSLASSLSKSNRNFPSSRFTALVSIYAQDANTFTEKLDFTTREFIDRYEEQIKAYQEKISRYAFYLGVFLQLLVTSLTASLSLTS